MSQISRRDTLKMFAVAPLAGLVACNRERSEQVHHQLENARSQGPYERQFFTDHEFETVKVLADIVIPRDERSGSATDAGVPDFMDFMMIDRPDGQTPMRGGLAWLDRYSLKKFGHSFVECDAAQRIEMVEAIAWPDQASPEVSQGVAFFNMFRDLTASGFWTSKIGIEDLQYLGNTNVPEWNGCPHEALEKLGVSYET